MSNVFGMLRIKNESRWIAEVIHSILPICQQVFILDDHSTDNTVEICRSIGGVTLYESPFDGLDERRDKNWLLRKIYDHVGPKIDAKSPNWALCIDGDEVLREGHWAKLQDSIESDVADAYSLKILYLWDKADQVRVDGVYARFARPSAFRLINPNFTFQTTPWGGNLHCSSIPQEFLGQAAPSDAALLHYGYIDRDMRLRKFQWYNQVDPGNPAEDCYRHMVQGDLPDVPAGARLLHAGPLDIRSLSSVS